MDALEIVCSRCTSARATKPAKDGGAKLPRGWKRSGADTYCDKCRAEMYALRAVSIPVAACDWNVIGPLHARATRDVTALANMLVSQYYAGDRRRLPGEEKMPPWKPPYVYPEARAFHPGIDSQCTVSLINTVQAKYRAARLQLWQGRTSLPTFRDLPVPLNRQAWRLEEREGRHVFSFRWCGVWHELTLRGGHEFRRQREQLAAILDGRALAGEAALYRHGKALMLKIAGYFPRRVGVAGSQSVVSARTASDAFLIAAAPAGAVWRLNADHVRRWIEGYAAQQQRLREDLKAERRFPREMRAGIVERMGEVGDRRHGRIDAWMHEASAQLVGWAQRQKASALSWDDSYPSMMPSFPWFVFAARLEDKCRAAGIEFLRASEYVATPLPESLASV